MLRFGSESRRPMIIAHRGACGMLPEQTLEAFDLAIDQGADAIELDIVPTRDGVLLARHESELSLTTNIASMAQFSVRRTRRTIDGVEFEGWFSEEFTTEEIRTLRARQRFAFRDHSFDDRFGIPTLDDVLGWQLSMPRAIGIFIEIKHPTYFAGIGLPISKLLSQTLSRFAVNRESGVSIKCFEQAILRELRESTDLPLIQLLDAPDARPFDWTTARDGRTYADLFSPGGLADIARYADGISAWKRLIVPTRSPDANGIAGPRPNLVAPTTLIRDAHDAGLFVSTWTFRDEPQFLAADYAEDPLGEYAQFTELGVDGLITDFPATARAAADHVPSVGPGY